MLAELCRELNNWFDEKPDGTSDRHFGTFVIENGSIDLSGTGIRDGQHFRIVGSVLNDGVYRYPAQSLSDETFDGAVWLMRVPLEVINLSTDIMAWQEKYGAADSAAMSPFQSESFGGYSYTKASGSSADGAGSAAPTWQSVFRGRLNVWRKIRP